VNSDVIRRGDPVRRLAIAVCATIGFLAIYGIGVYLGDLVGIGGYAGWAPEETYREFQFGAIEPWLYKATELAAFAALLVGSAGSVVSLGFVLVLLVVGAFKIVRGAL